MVWVHREWDFFLIFFLSRFLWFFFWEDMRDDHFAVYSVFSEQFWRSNAIVLFLRFSLLFIFHRIACTWQCAWCFGSALLFLFVQIVLVSFIAFNGKCEWKKRKILLNLTKWHHLLNIIRFRQRRSIPKCFDAVLASHNGPCKKNVFVPLICFSYSVRCVSHGVEFREALSWWMNLFRLALDNSNFKFDD